MTGLQRAASASFGCDIPAHGIANSLAMRWASAWNRYRREPALRIPDAELGRLAAASKNAPLDLPRSTNLNRVDLGPQGLCTG